MTQSKYKITYQNIKQWVILISFVSLFSPLSPLPFPLLPLLSYLSPSQALAASQGLAVSPFIINVPLSPGKKYTREITIENLTDTPLPLRARLNDFETSGEEGGYIFEESRTNPLLTWTKLNETEFLLAPKEKKKLQLTISTPKSIPFGGYYGMLFFEQVLTDENQGTTRVASKVGILLLANIGSPDPKAKKADILTFKTGLFHNDNSLPLLLRVQNVSLHFFTAKPILTISPLLGFSSDKQETKYLEDKIIFQGKIRRWEQVITLDTLQPNIYKAQMVLSTGNGEHVVKENYFIIFPFLKTFVIGIVLLVAIILIKKWKTSRRE